MERKSLIDDKIYLHFCCTYEKETALSSCAFEVGWNKFAQQRQPRLATDPPPALSTSHFVGIQMIGARMIRERDLLR